MLVTAARFRPDHETDEQRTRRLDAKRAFIDAWGTDRSLTLKFQAPSVAEDPVYREWQPRYERQSASPAALAELIEMLDDIDVRPILPRVTVPTLVLHRQDDPVIPIERAREVADLIPRRPVRGAVRCAITWATSATSTAGRRGRAVHDRPAGRAPATLRRPPTRPAIKLIGGFAVSVDGADVPTRRVGIPTGPPAVQAARRPLGRPVTRDGLAETLWPDGDPDRLSSQTLGPTVRRPAHPGRRRDRRPQHVRLDLDNVDVDLAAIYRRPRCRRRPAAVDTCPGDLLPDDLYDDWTAAPRMRLRGASPAPAAASPPPLPRTTRSAQSTTSPTCLDLDPYDEWAHEQLANTLTTCGRYGEARQAELRYRKAMNELGIRPRNLTGTPNNRSDQNHSGDGVQPDTGNHASDNDTPKPSPTSADTKLKRRIGRLGEVEAGNNGKGPACHRGAFQPEPGMAVHRRDCRAQAVGGRAQSDQNSHEVSRAISHQGLSTTSATTGDRRPPLVPDPAAHVPSSPLPG